MSESSLIARINAAGEVFREFGGETLAREVIGRGGSLADFYRGLAPRVSSGNMDLDKRSGLSLSTLEVGNFSIGRMIRTEVQGAAAHKRELPDPFDKNAATEREILLSERAAQCFEHRAAGGRIPWSVLARDYNTDQAGGLIPTNLGTGYTGDALRAALPLVGLGAQLLVLPANSGGFKVPVVTGDLTNVTFLGEVDAATDGALGTGMVDFTARRVTAYLEVSRQSIMQGGAALDAVLARVIFGKVRASIEDAALNGDGAGDNPLGIRSTPGINTVEGGANGAALSWGHLTDLEYEPAADNAPEVAPGYLVNPATRRYLKRTQRAAGLPFMWDAGDRPLAGHRAAASTLLPSNLTKGTAAGVCSSVVYSSDWSMLMIAAYGAPELVVDPFTKSKDGIIRLIFNTYVAPGVLHQPAFAVMEDALLA